jgi:hypothetical protein
MYIKLVIIVKMHFAIPEIKLALATPEGEYIQQGNFGNFMPPPHEIYQTTSSIREAFTWESSDAAILWANRAGFTVRSNIMMSFTGGRMFFKNVGLTTDPTDLMNEIQKHLKQIPPTALPLGKECDFKLYMTGGIVTYKIAAGLLTQDCNLQLEW